MLWYGTEDWNTPLHAAKKMAALLKKARFKVYHGKDHFTFGRFYYKKIFNSMLKGKIIL